MPLEISEIGVHLAVGHGPGPGGSAPQPANRQDQPDQAGASPEQIVELCVQEVLKILARREER